MLVNLKKKKSKVKSMADTKIEFNSKDHTYMVSDNVIPSVTQVLPELPEHLQYSQAFIDKTFLGTRVHYLTETLDRMSINSVTSGAIKITEKQLHEDGISEYKIQELDLSYVDGWLAFRKDSKFVANETEIRVYSAKFGYAGTVDRIGHHPELFDGKKSILDIKTVTKVSPTVALQMAGYLGAYNEEWPDSPCIGRIAVQLLPDGGYNVHPYEERTLSYDLNVFLAKVISKRWDIENKIGG